jgi:hypothetical protein
MADWNRRRRLTNIFGALLNLKNGSINQTSTRRIKSKIEQTWGAIQEQNWVSHLAASKAAVSKERQTAGCSEQTTINIQFGAHLNN